MASQRSDTDASSGSDSSTPVPLSDPQEIEFLPVREGRQWGEVEVDRSVRDFNDLAADSDADAGRRFWRRADKLTELYVGFPERAKGVATFVGLCRQELHLTKQEVNELLRVRQATDSGDEAGAIGRRKLSLGVRLNEAIGLKGFDALRKLDLKCDDEGGTCRFPQGTVDQLQSALDLLKEAAKPKVSRRLLADVKNANEALKEAQREDPELDEADVEFVPGDGEPVLSARRLTPAQFKALAAFMKRWLDGR